MDSEAAWAAVTDLALQYADVDSEPSGDAEFERIEDRLELAILEYARVLARASGDKHMAGSFGAMIAQAKENQSSNFIRDGAYLFEVRKLLIEKKRKGLTFIAEMVVKEAIQTTKGIEPNAVGSSVGYVVRIDDPDGMGLGNVKSFFMGLFGASGAEIDGDTIDWAINTDPRAKNSKGEILPVQPCAGMLIRDEAFSKPQAKDPSKSFTRHAWKTVDPQPDAAAS